LGHITNDFYSINQSLKQFFFFAKLITVEPEKIGEDLVITKDHISASLNGKTEALIIRTLPNQKDKKSRKYSNTNPPYLSEEAAIFIRETEIQHLLIDLPSVDKEHDEGKLLAHKAFWNVKDTLNLNPDARFNATITEMIFAANEIEDGDYILNIQIASFENDASPSKPILYKIL
ncbi:MAG: cyclase family protein, partial [Flavobacterium sp.]